MSNDQTVASLLADARETYSVFGKPQRALPVVDRVLEQEPENVEALNLRAAILYDLDRDEEAAVYHRKALDVSPHSVEALHGLAAIANDTKDYRQALQWLEQAFTSVPEDPYAEFRENEDFRQRLIAELYNEKAFALWYSGRKKEATQLLTVEAPEVCPLEVETFEDEYAWLEEHPVSPDEE